MMGVDDNEEPHPRQHRATGVVVELGFGGYTVQGELRSISPRGAYLRAPTTATVGTLVTLTFETEQGEHAEVVGRTGRFVALESGVIVAVDFVGSNRCFSRWAEAAERGDAPPISGARLRIR